MEQIEQSDKNEQGQAPQPAAEQAGGARRPGGPAEAGRGRPRGTRAHRAGGVLAAVAVRGAPVVVVTAFLVHLVLVGRAVVAAVEAWVFGAGWPLVAAVAEATDPVVAGAGVAVVIVGFGFWSTRGARKRLVRSLRVLLG